MAEIHQQFLLEPVGPAAAAYNQISPVARIASTLGRALGGLDLPVRPEYQRGNVGAMTPQRGPKFAGGGIPNLDDGHRVARSGRQQATFGRKREGGDGFVGNFTRPRFASVARIYDLHGAACATHHFARNQPTIRTGDKRWP